MSYIQIMWVANAVIWGAILGGIAFLYIHEHRRSKTQVPIGSKWVLRRKGGDPWPKEPTCVITVIDCKDKWVRYQLGSSGMFQDERMKTSSFLYCYQAA